MAIVMLHNATSLTDVARRAFGLGADDPRVATAVKALADANPHLPADLRGCPAGTPVVVPPVDGLPPVAQPLPALPQNADLLKLVQQVGDAAHQIVAPAEGRTPLPSGERAVLLQRFAAAQKVLNEKTPELPPVDRQAHAAQVKALRDDVAAFLKLHKA